MKKIESLVLGWRKAGKSFDEIERDLHTKKLLKGNGSNLELWTDLRDMDGKPLRKLPQEELFTMLAEILKSSPDLKPIEMRDQAWINGVHCYRRDIRAFKKRLERNGVSPDHYLKEAEKTQVDVTPPDSFPINDFRMLRELIGRHGKDKIQRVIRGAF